MIKQKDTFIIPQRTAAAFDHQVPSNKYGGQGLAFSQRRGAKDSLGKIQTPTLSMKEKLQG